MPERALRDLTNLRQTLGTLNYEFPIDMYVTALSIRSRLARATYDSTSLSKKITNYRKPCFAPLAVGPAELCKIQTVLDPRQNR